MVGGMMKIHLVIAGIFFISALLLRFWLVPGSGETASRLHQ